MHLWAEHEHINYKKKIGSKVNNIVVDILLYLVHFLHSEIKDDNFDNFFNFQCFNWKYNIFTWLNAANIA